MWHVDVESAEAVLKLVVSFTLRKVLSIFRNNGDTKKLLKSLKSRVHLIDILADLLDSGLLAARTLPHDFFMAALVHYDRADCRMIS